MIQKIGLLLCLIIAFGKVNAQKKVSNGSSENADSGEKSVRSQNQVRIIDGDSGSPLEFVTISTDGPNEFVVTNENGEAALDGFNIKETLYIRMMGYKTDTITHEELLERGYVVKLQPSNYELSTVSLYASHATRPEPNITKKNSTLSAASIAEQNGQTTADLLANTGEVFVQKSQMAGGSPMIRGFSANRLLITVDGTRMNTAIFRSGNLQNIISIDQYSIESADVIFGPGSVMYGSDAIGGVMSFNTFNPQLATTDTTEITGNYANRIFGGNNEFTNHFDLNIGFKKLAYYGAVTYSDFGDMKMGQHGPDEYLRPTYASAGLDDDIVLKNENERKQLPTRFNQWNVMQKLRYEVNKNLALHYGFHYSTTSDAPRYDRLIRFSDSLPVSAEWYYGPQKWMMNQLRMVYHKENKLFDEFTLIAAVQNFEESRFDRDFGDDYLYKRYEKVDAYSLNLDLNKRLNSKNTINYGLEGVLNTVESIGRVEDITNGNELDDQSRYPNSDWASYGVYIASHHKLLSKFIGELGMRYTIFELQSKFDTTLFSLPFEEASLQNDAISGSAGLLYEVNSSTKINLNVSSGFRAPNVDDMGKVFDSEPGSVVVPNPDLKAEYVYSGEIGINKHFHHFSVDVSFYYTLLDNALVRRDDQLEGKDSVMYDGELSQVQSVQNAAQANIFGVNAGAMVNLGKWRIISKINFQKGEEEMDDGSISASRHVSPTFGNTHIQYRRSKVLFDLFSEYSGAIPFEDLNVNERGKAYLYAIDSDGNPYSPSWYTLNFEVTFELLKETAQLTTGLNNITDQRYRTYSSGIASPGRNFILALRAAF